MSSHKVDPRSYIAPSVSNKARAKLETARALFSQLPVAALPQTLEDFDAAVERGALFAEQLSRSALDMLAPVITERTLGGVAALDVRSRDYSDDGTALLYIHGGGFVQGSAVRAAGQASRLELYEGMPHVFQSLLADAPEGKAAWAEIAAFWAEHLSS